MPKAKRRTFSAEYKRDIVRKADACKESGEIGALLRGEGLYSSHLTEWRRELEAHGIAGLTAKKRGPKPQPGAAEEQELAALRRENAELKVRADRAELLVEIQKKVSRILGVALTRIDGERR